MLINKVEYDALITNIIIIFFTNMIILMINIFIEQFFIAKKQKNYSGSFSKITA